MKQVELEKEKQKVELEMEEKMRELQESQDKRKRELTRKAEEEKYWLEMKRIEAEAEHDDIIAQYEAVIALGKIPSPATCATLMWVLKDSNFFYRVRMEAAHALTKFDTPELEYVGLTNLTKFLKENYTMPNVDLFIPKRNNFEDLQDYHLKSSICIALAKYRNPKGWSPPACRSMLIDLLVYNDNTGNKVIVVTYILEL